MQARHLVSEAVTGALARPMRAGFTALGTVLGVGALVVTLGLARTAGNQLLIRFDELAATEVVVTAASQPGSEPTAEAAQGLPMDAEARLSRLNGVDAVGVLADVGVVGGVTAVPALGEPGAEVGVMSASPGVLRAVRGSMAVGRWLDPVFDRTDGRVAVLGPGAARLLGVDRIDVSPAIFIEDQAFVVIGVLDDVERQPDMLNAVIIPRLAANQSFLTTDERVIVDTAVGAAQLIGTQAPLALSPADPSRLEAQVPPGISRQRDAAAADINILLLSLGIVCLVAGALSIANVTMISVVERTSEIGLRRALGATRRSVVLQLLVESVILGLLGGLVGTSLGVTIVVAVAAARDWTPLLDPALVLAAPVVGSVLGGLAGLYPAHAAGALEPAESVRAGVV